MLFIVRMLAVLGVLAVIAQAGRALFSLMRGGVDMFLARDLHGVRAQRGDLTGMQEAVELRRAGRNRRAIAALKLSIWVVLLIIPSFTPWATPMRAAYVVFWFLPRQRGGLRARVDVRVLK